MYRRTVSAQPEVMRYTVAGGLPRGNADDPLEQVVVAAPEPDDDDEAKHEAADQAAVLAQQVGDGLIRADIDGDVHQGQRQQQGVRAVATTASRKVTKRSGSYGRTDPAGSLTLLTAAPSSRWRDATRAGPAQ